MKSEIIDVFEALKENLKQNEGRMLLVITLVMLFVEYLGWQQPFFRLVAPYFRESRQVLTLYAQIYTTASFILFFMIIPTLMMKFTLGSEMPRLGFKAEGKLSLKIYLLIGSVMFLVLAGVCSSPNFYKFYPLYRPQNWGQWLTFELIYLPQFLAVEYFFRGPLLYFFASKTKMAAALMTLPYAIIHIHKPMPEAIGSIVAGLVLSHLSLKNKSIIPGVALHMFIAISADAFGLFYSGTMKYW